MAADQGIANAYNRYFQAQETENLMSDPFYQMTQLAIVAAEEWKKEKKLFEETANKYAERYEQGAETALVNAMDGLTPQGQEIVNDYLGQLNTQMDVAKKQGNKTKIRALHADAQKLSGQLKKVNTLTADHLAAIKGGTYSKGADRVKLDQITDKDNPNAYSLFIETDPEKEGYGVPYLQMKDANGGVVAVSIDELDEGNVMRNDQLADTWNQTLANSVKVAIDEGDHKFDEDEYSRMIDRVLADKDTLISATHDDLFGQGVSIADGWRTNHQNQGDSWMNVWQKGETVEGASSGALEAGGFNEAELRSYTKEKMMDFAKTEFKRKLKLRQKRIESTSRAANPQSGSFQVGQHQWVKEDIVDNTISDIRANKSFTFEEEKFTTDNNGKWTDEDGVVLNVDDLINSLDQNRGYIRQSTKWRNLLKPEL